MTNTTKTTTIDELIQATITQRFRSGNDVYGEIMNLHTGLSSLNSELWDACNAHIIPDEIGELADDAAEFIRDLESNLSHLHHTLVELQVRLQKAGKAAETEGGADNE